MTWLDAYQDVQDRTRRDPAFPALVSAMTGYPRGNSRRARRLADAICGRLGLLPAAYRGNVYGAALDAQARRSLHA